MEQKPKPEAPLSIQRIHIEDFQRVVLADITPNRVGLVLIRGQNEHGKTSIIEATLETLGIGKSAMPIRKGAHNSATLLDLGDVIVKGHWTRDAAGKAKRSISVESPPGEKVDRPAEVLKKLRGHMADPSIFTSMKSEDQAKMILAVLGIDEELSKLERIEASHFEARTIAGREKDRTEKAFIQLDAELDGVPEREPGVSVAELAESLREAEATNNRRSNQEIRKSTAEEQAKKDSARIAAIGKEIEQLQEEADDLAISVESHRANWRSAEQFLQDNKAVDLEPFRLSLADAETAAQNVGRRELWQSTKTEHETAATAHGILDAAVETARAAVTKLLGSVEFPVEGMTYDSATKKILVNGLPSEQWSQAQRIRIAATVAMSGDPRLKVIFAREGSLIDQAGQDLLHALAVEKGFLLLLEVVDSKREGKGIWIEDGYATQKFDTDATPTIAEGIAAASDPIARAQAKRAVKKKAPK